MNKKVYTITGKEIRSVELNDAVFAREVSDGSIYHAIRNELANKRIGTASTKTRSEVRGSHKKPWKQKGTGRARVGTRQSPLWVGGGVIFGPRPRDYSYTLPKRVKRLALISLLSLKAKDENVLKVVEDFEINDGKTKKMAEILKVLANEKATTLILNQENPLVRRAGRNIANLKILAFNRLNAHDLFYSRTVLVMESAINSLNTFYQEKKNER